MYNTIYAVSQEDDDEECSDNEMKEPLEINEIMYKTYDLLKGLNHIIEISGGWSGQFIEQMILNYDQQIYETLDIVEEWIDNNKE